MLSGLIAPLLTPFDQSGLVIHDLYHAHANDMLQKGCTGLVPFGTTGEALSIGIDERIDIFKELIANGIKPELTIPGTGLTNIADTGRLSTHMLNMGAKAVLVLPPFYNKDVSDEGLYAYFANLIAHVGKDMRIVLYHIPQQSGVGFSLSLVERLKNEFPDQIVGIKDSSSDWDNLSSLLSIQGLTVYPGSELHLQNALRLGATGCISATANLNAVELAQIIKFYNAGDYVESQNCNQRAVALRSIISHFPTIAAYKNLLSKKTNDSRWQLTRAPMEPLTVKKAESLKSLLGNNFNHIY